MVSIALCHQFSYVKLKNVTFALKALSTNPLERKIEKWERKIRKNPLERKIGKWERKIRKNPLERKLGK